MARVGGMWLDSRGPTGPIRTGCLLVLFGVVWLALTAHYSNYWYACVGFLAYGIGAPLIISPAIALVLGSVPLSHIGMASGMFNTMRQLGAAMCFAVVGVVITNTYFVHAKQLLSQMSLHNLNPNKLFVLIQQPVNLSQEQVLHLSARVPLIYNHAFSMGMWVAVIFAGIGCAAALFVLRSR